MRYTDLPGFKNLEGLTCNVLTAAGRGLQPRPKRLTDEDMAVVVENARDGGATPVPLVVHKCQAADRFRLLF